MPYFSNIKFYRFRLTFLVKLKDIFSWPSYGILVVEDYAVSFSNGFSYFKSSSKTGSAKKKIKNPDLDLYPLINYV